MLYQIIEVVHQQPAVTFGVAVQPPSFTSTPLEICSTFEIANKWIEYYNSKKRVGVEYMLKPLVVKNEGPILN